METNVDKLRNKLGPFFNLVMLCTSENRWEIKRLIEADANTAYDLMDEVKLLLEKIENEDKFTVDEFKLYLESQDSFGDALYNCNAGKIRLANENQSDEEDETKEFMDYSE